MGDPGFEPEQVRHSRHVVLNAFRKGTRRKRDGGRWAGQRRAGLRRFRGGHERDTGPGRPRGAAHCIRRLGRGRWLLVVASVRSQSSSGYSDLGSREREATDGGRFTHGRSVQLSIVAGGRRTAAAAPVAGRGRAACAWSTDRPWSARARAFLMADVHPVAWASVRECHPTAATSRLSDGREQPRSQPPR